MKRRLKNALRTILDRLRNDACGITQPAPDKTPDAGSRHGSFSTGIHFEALEPRLLLSATGESAAFGAAVPTPQPLAQVDLQSDHFEFASQNNALATDLLHSTESSKNEWSAEPEPSVNLIGNDQQPGQNTSTANSVNAVSADFEIGPAATSTLDPVDILANADAQPLDTITARQELVLVDGGIPNYEQLLTDLLFKRDDGLDIEVMVLDPDRDGIAQISDFLTERQDLDAIHIVSHGTDTAIKLGNLWIRGDNIDTYAGSIADWKSSLSDGADLLMYGCNLAAGETGQALIKSFAHLTGADVAASEDNTGHASLGGDWVLEHGFGTIEDDVALSMEIQHRWMGLLSGDSDGDGLLDEHEDANTDLDNNPTTNPGPDTDSDTFVNYLDADDDNDGTPTSSENADPNADGDPRDAVDTDRDGQPDYLDLQTSVSDGTVDSEQKISDTTLSILANKDQFGESLTGIGDLDGDGINDMAVGASGDDDGGAVNSDRGAVHILFMNADGTVKSSQKISDTAGNFTGTLDNDDKFGQSVAGIGDLDGDGVIDLAVGANKDDDGGTDRGAVYILFLNADGTVKSSQKISDTGGSFSGTLDNDDQFGKAVAAIGDVDGDGINDLAVGAPRDDDGGSNKGAVYILMLNPDGTVKSHHKVSATSGDLAPAPAIDDEFGAAVAGIGDLDGDGTSDIAVGADRDDGSGGNNRGAVYILRLNADGTVKAEQKIGDGVGGLTATLDDGDKFGNALGGIGDVDGDGISDIAVGANNDDDGGPGRGAVYILFLDTDGTVKSEQKISDTAGGFNGTLADDVEFGSSVGGIGDLDGDGAIDIAVGAPNDDDGGNKRGAVYVLNLTATNNAPVLADDNPLLTDVAEDNLTSAGDSVAAIVVDGSITDADGAVESIAITGVDNANGTWQYSTDNGSNWSNVDDGSLAVDHALLLDGTLTGVLTQKLRFVPNADYNGTVTFTFRAWDQTTGIAGNYADTSSNGGTTSYSTATDTAQVTVTAVNDPPTATIGPTGFGVDEDDGFRGISGFSVDDIDIGSGKVAVTLTADNGKINLLITTGLTFTDGANGTGNMTFTATVTDANNAIANNSIQYKGNDDFNGTDTVTLSVNDQGNTGSGGPLSDSDTVSITVDPVNDAPVVGAPGAALNATEQVGLAIHGTDFTVGDVDEDGLGALATLSVGEGTLTVVPGNSGVTVTGGNGTDSVTLTGTIAQIDNLLTAAGTGVITYLNDLDTPSASTTLTVTVNDQGNTGEDPGSSGDGISEEGTNVVTINVAAVNDEPVHTVPPTQNTPQNTSLVFSTGNGNLISVDDVDAGNAQIEVTLTATFGKITITGAAGDPIPVTANSSREQSGAAIARAADGRIATVWASKDQDGSSWGIYAQRYTSTGSVDGGEFLVNSFTTNEQEEPAVAMDDNGNFVVVWQSKDKPGDSSYGIYAQLYDNTGTPDVSGEIHINTTTSDNQTSPEVAMDANGNFVVVWEDDKKDGNAGIFARLFNSAGTAQGSEFQVNQTPSKEQTSPSVAMDADGDFVVVWESKDQAGGSSSFDVYGRRYNDDGSAKGGEFLVNTHTSKEQEKPRVALDTNGDFVVVWQSKDQPAAAATTSMANSMTTLALPSVMSSEPTPKLVPISRLPTSL